MTKALDCALRLLTRREHGAFELRDKLQAKGYSQELANQALQSCQELGLQSDSRYVESFCRTRIHQGYGPLKITQDLMQKRINRELISSILSQEDAHWVDYALAVWQKKSKNQNLSLRELQKQQRFLLYRGFSPDIIAQVLKVLKNSGDNEKF